MSALLDSELLKLRSTRTFFALVASAIGLIVLIAIAAASAGSFDDPTGTPGSDLLTVAAIPQLFTMVLGILAVSTEFRHGTITPTLLATPGRTRLVVAKLIVHFIAGLAIGLVTALIALALVSGILSARGIDTRLSTSDAIDIVAGLTVAAGIWCGIGVGIGTLVRNQVGAIVAALAWVFAIENLLTAIPGISDAVLKFGFNGLGNGLSGASFGGGDSSDLLAQVPAGLLLAAYGAVLVIAGIVVLRRRDVSA